MAGTGVGGGKYVVCQYAAVAVRTGDRSPISHIEDVESVQDAKIWSCHIH